SGKRCGVSHDHVVANDTVMRDVYVSHQQAIASDPRDPAAPGSSAVNSHAFADHIIVADLHPRDLALELQVLRLEPNGPRREDAIIAAHLERPAKHHV